VTENPGVTGLRRFVRRPAGAPAPGLQARVPGGLPVPLGTRRDDPPGTERCEMCQTVLDARHGHLVDLDKRSIACACRACYLLFTHEGAAGGRYKAVPERICHDPDQSPAWGLLIRL